MLKGNKLRLYPNHEQMHTLACMFGNQRFVWNQMLGMLNSRYKNNKKSIFPNKYDLTTKIVQSYDTIVIEDLKVSNMVKNHHLAHKIEHQSWYEFRRELEYKCEWYGKKLIVVDPKNTSRICSSCGQKNYEFDDLDQSQWLATREWICPKCKTYHNRDVNAAQNILNKGLTLA